MLLSAISNLFGTHGAGALWKLLNHNSTLGNAPLVQFQVQLSLQPAKFFRTLIQIPDPYLCLKMMSSMMPYSFA